MMKIRQRMHMPHTRGRTVLKPPAPLPDENKISYKVKKVYYDRELLEGDIKKAMMDEGGYGGL